jgi:methylenetetrahydrofolate reductase (NADPH)
MESQKKRPRVFSFEFFPPKDTEARARLNETIAQLAQLKPRFFSVTFGAGGSTRAGTYETIKDIHDRGLAAAPHLTCIGSTQAEIRELLRAYVALGIDRLVALRGDPRPGGGAGGDFRHANELVAFIRQETGDHFHIEVAAYPEFHPEAPDAETDIGNFVRKVQAGADSALTQYFFNPDAYCRFVDDCEARGLDIPLVPGIMPITNYRQLARFSDNCGAEIPRWIRRRLEDFGDDLESLRAFGLDVTSDLCAKLLAAGAPGLHFYTLNRAGPVCAVWERLGLGP